MTATVNPDQIFAQFKLPPQDADILSFCAGRKAAKVAEWVNALKHTQVSHTAAMLYQAIQEIVHLRTDAKTRFEMLESLWPTAQHAIQGLSREFLNQPLILPPSGQKAALVAQALQKHFVDGYSLCAKEIHEQKRTRQLHREILVNTLFRAATGAGQLILRNAQLYTQAPPGIWLRLHGLMQIATFHDLQKVPITLDQADVVDVRSIQDAWLHVVSFACVRPNQLSQSEIALAYRALEGWARHVDIHGQISDDRRNLFLVDLSADKPPVGKSRFKAGGQSMLVELDFQRLINQLSKLSDDLTVRADSLGQIPGVSIPANLPEGLKKHILGCWSQAASRHQDRQPANQRIDVCLGLIDCHYQLANQTSFNDFLNDPVGAPGSGAPLDSFMRALHPEDDNGNRSPRPSIFSITLQNTSPGGYCLLWTGDLPSRLEAGELIGVRGPDGQHWNLGIIRWIRQLKNASQLGLQLLTDEAIPFGAAIMYDMGGYSDYMRAIHIATPSIPGQPPSLLTAAVPFKEGLRVKMKQEASDIDIRLKKCVYSTGKIRLFSFETLAPREK